MFLQERLENAINNPENPEILKNCVGTALYLANITENEKNIQPYSISNYISSLEKIKQPQLECFVIFRNTTLQITKEKIRHIGIVDNLYQLCITHRDGANGIFYQNDPINNVIKKYGNNIEYRIPEKT